MKRITRSSTAAFTLLEIMLVVMIIALLAGIAILKMGGALDEAGNSTAKAHLQQFEVCLLSYRAKAGFYPTTAQGLKALTSRPSIEPIPRSWSSLMDNVPKDPWDSDYIYEQPGKHNTDRYDIYSPGPNRIPGDADDIGNWTDKTKS
jgi:general secretion pathway protein G